MPEHTRRPAWAGRLAPTAPIQDSVRMYMDKEREAIHHHMTLGPWGRS